MIEKILKHIKKEKEWQDKLFYLNYEEDLPAIIKWYYFERLRWCGCGMPGEAMRTIEKYLETRKLQYPESRDKLREYFPPDGDANPLVLCLAYEMDRAGFTEHGTSIYGCWLTEDGEYFLWAIKEADKQDVLEI